MTTTTVSQEAVEVTQADREAYLSMNTLLQKYRDDVMAGEWDSANGMQALARHRHQAERDTLARMASVIRRCTYGSCPMPEWCDRSRCEAPAPEAGQ